MTAEQQKGQCECESRSHCECRQTERPEESGAEQGSEDEERSGDAPYGEVVGVCAERGRVSHQVGCTLPRDGECPCQQRTTQSQAAAGSQSSGAARDGEQAEGDEQQRDGEQQVGSR